jgi:hypothetical protein
MKSYFYKILNKINGKYYYGTTDQDDLKKYGGSNTILKKAYLKYGKDNFEFNKLKFFDAREDAFIFEDRFLKLYNLAEDKNSYNLKNSGKGGDTISKNPNRDEIVKKLGRKGRVSNRKGIEMTEEQKIKISISLKKSYKNGRKKINEKGSKLSEEHKNKISKSLKGKMIGEKNGMWRKGKKILVDGVVYNSITECSKTLNIHVKTITYRLNNKNKIGWDYINK